MKQFRMLLIGLFAGALLATAGSSFGATALNKITAMLRPDYTVKVDGKQVELKNAPIAYNDTTYVPLREAGEIFGYKVGFKSGTISLDQIEKDVDNVIVPTESTTSIRIRDLVNLLGEKYPELADVRKISFNNGTNVLKFNDQTFTLTRYEDDTISPVPLIEAGILTIEELQ
jgi:hypothetical protein